MREELPESSRLVTRSFFLSPFQIPHEFPVLFLSLGGLSVALQCLLGLPSMQAEPEETCACGLGRVEPPLGRVCIRNRTRHPPKGWTLH